MEQAFKTYRKKGRGQIRADLARCLASLLQIEDAQFGALVDTLAKTSNRSSWTPTAHGFFTRVNGQYLDNLHRCLLGLEADHPTVTTFNRLKKSERAERLEKLFSDEDYRTALGLSKSKRQRIDNWLPEEMG